MPVIIGHRGAPGYRPEHTRSSYEVAIDQGAAFIEPDVVATSDGVLVVRHENEISGTTDIADRPEFAHRRTTKSFAGHEVTGWFTEDFTWDELATLFCRERIPQIRPGNVQYDAAEPMLRLRDVLDIARTNGVGVVVEIKHAPYFASIGLDLAPLVGDELIAAGWQDPERSGSLIIESFEESALRAVRERGIRARFVYLLEQTGAALDLVLAHGSGAPTYRDQLNDVAGLADRFDGISVHKNLLLAGDTEFAARAIDAGLDLFTWTCRPENAFLARRFRTPGGRSAFGEWRAEWDEIRRSGVPGVFADHPDLAREVFG
ncbi:MAG: glycerophosphodiester phosphodiesterase family protein [Microbacterium gubbeenense]